MKLQKDAQRTPSSALDKITVYYPNANINSAISKYKNGNYSGCLQELFSLTQKDPSNAVAYYYMALAYTHVDMQDDAIESYEKVIALSPNSYLVDYAVKGRDCLTGGLPANRLKIQVQKKVIWTDLLKLLTATVYLLN